MADSILRLKVESQEYDAKLKRAAQGLQQYADGCRKAGGTLEVVEKETLDFVKAIGEMETVSKSAKGKLNEMTQAFTELSVQYKQLTEEEKGSPFGKALSESIDKLKGRIQNGKNELASINNEISGGGGLTDSLEALAGKFGLSIKSLTGWGAALGAGTAALKVAKDAFFASEQNIDEWGRFVRSSQTIWEGFLTSINTGDISGYLDRIEDIRKAAVEAYNALDKLSTQKAIDVPKLDAQQTENERLRAMLRTGRGIAQTNPDLGFDFDDGEKLSKEQLEQIKFRLEGGVKEVNDIIRKEIEQSNIAIDALYNEQAKVLGMSKEDFLEGTANIDELEKRLERYKKYQDFEGRRASIRSAANSGHNITKEQADMLTAVNPFADAKGWGVFKDDGKMYSEITNQIKERSSLQRRLIQETANAYRQINRVDGGGGKGGTTITPLPVAGSIDEQTAKVQDLQKAWRAAADDDSRQKIKKEIEEQQYILDRMTGKEIPANSLADLNQQISDLRKQQSLVTSTEDWELYRQKIAELTIQVKELKGELKMEGVRISDMTRVGIPTRESILKKGQQRIGNFKLPENKENTDTTKSLQTLTGGMSQLVCGIQQMGITIPSEIQSVIGVLQGITTILTAIQTLNSIKFWAGGGVVHANSGLLVPGNHFSGDMVPSMINSGELILNQAQQGNLASQLQAASMINGGGGHDYVSGQNIYLGTNNYLKGSGQGQLVTTRMLRQYGLIN